jgi:hypothetical protein
VEQLFAQAALDGVQRSACGGGGQDPIKQSKLHPFRSLFLQILLAVVLFHFS